MTTAVYATPVGFVRLLVARTMLVARWVLAGAMRLGLGLYACFAGTIVMATVIYFTVVLALLPGSALEAIVDVLLPAGIEPREGMVSHITGAAVGLVALLWMLAAIAVEIWRQGVPAVRSGTARMVEAWRRAGRRRSETSPGALRARVSIGARENRPPTHGASDDGGDPPRSDASQESGDDPPRREPAKPATTPAAPVPGGAPSPPRRIASVPPGAGRSSIISPPSRPTPIRSSKPLVGYRKWYVVPESTTPDDPIGRLVLGSVGVNYAWPDQHVVAECRMRGYPASLARPRHHPRVPDEACRCGVYAVKRPEDVPGYNAHGWAGVTAVGAVALSGRVIQARYGYRAEKARIVGPLRIYMRCPGSGGLWCLAPAAGVLVDGEDGWRALCGGHLGPLRHRPGYRSGLDASPDVIRTTEFLTKVRARLEVRYGVDVVIEREEKPYGHR